MSIELHENKWAKNMIETHDLGKKPSETLRRVARYYMDCGQSKKEARSSLEKFILECDPGASLPRWSNAIEYAVRRAAKSPAIDIDDISITEEEIKKIDALDGRQIKRLAFTLLCLAKYWSFINPDNDYWINCDNNAVMTMANINTSVKRQCAMYRTLQDADMIKPSKKVDGTSFRVCFVSDSAPAIHIKDFRNLGYQYLKYHGESYFECANCGLTTKITHPENNRKPKYCSDCALKIRIRQTVESVMQQKGKSSGSTKSI